MNLRSGPPSTAYLCRNLSWLVPKIERSRNLYWPYTSSGELAMGVPDRQSLRGTRRPSMARYLETFDPAALARWLSSRITICRSP